MKSLTRNQRIATLLVLALTIFLMSCARTVPVEVGPAANTYSFIGGLWHGIILPFSFIGSLFNDEVVIYAVNNTGNWYNFGFVLGASIIFGGSGASGRKRKKA